MPNHAGTFYYNVSSVVFPAQKKSKTSLKFCKTPLSAQNSTSKHETVLIFAVE